MARLEVRALAAADIPATATLLAKSFLDDPGMVVLFPDHSDHVLKEKMQHWFHATIHMWFQKQQMMFGAFENSDLLGVLLAGRTDFRVSGLAQLFWTVEVGWHCGPATVVRTAQHDAHRQDSFPPNFAHIVEFVVVDPRARGKGIGRLLFDQFHTKVGPSADVWLETTREENLSIFGKLGYQRHAHSTSLGAKFCQMIKPATKETSIATS